MKKITYPITDENFSEAWKYANGKLSAFKKKRVIRLFLKPLANITFLLCWLLVSYGMLTLIEEEMVANVLGSITIMKNAWNLLAPLVNQPGMEIGAKIGVCFGILFLVPIFVSVVTAVLVWFIYKPKRNEETGDKQVDSKTLWDVTKELNARRDHQKGVFSLCLMPFLLAAIAYLAVLCIAYILKENNIIIFASMIDLTMAMIEPYIAPYKTYFVMGVEVLVAVVVGLYTIFSAVLNLLLRPFYRTRVNVTLKNACEDYYYVCNPDAKALKDEEDLIFTTNVENERARLEENRKEYTFEEEDIRRRAEQIREKAREERKTLAKKVSYRHPVFVTLEVLSYLLPVVLIYMSVNNIANMSTEAIMDRFGIVYITDMSAITDIPGMEDLPPEVVEILVQYEKLSPEAQQVILTGDVEKIKESQEVVEFLKENGLYGLIDPEYDYEDYQPIETEYE